MSLIGPHLVTTLYDLYLTNPSNWREKNDVGESKDRTLDGTEVIDVYYRKYGYELLWDAMREDEYNLLMQLVNHQIDRGVDITFTWGKWPQTTTGVKVIARVSQRDFKAGKGATGYYSSVTLVLTEVITRQS